jgi:carbon monoxide dehydrogenase subunit G
MAKNLTAVGLDFLASAPNRTVTQVRLKQPVEVVFGALAEQPESWGSWYPGFGAGGYTSPAPHGVGSVREMKVGGLLTVETILAWDAPSRWAFYISKATMPGIRSFAEDYALAPDGAGTVLTWTLAVDLAPAAKPLGPLLGKLGPRLTRRAFANLERRLTTDAAD